MTPGERKLTKTTKRRVRAPMAWVSKTWPAPRRCAALGVLGRAHLQGKQPASSPLLYASADGGAQEVRRRVGGGDVVWQLVCCATASRAGVFVPVASVCSRCCFLFPVLRYHEAVEAIEVAVNTKMAQWSQLVISLLTWPGNSPRKNKMDNKTRCRFVGGVSHAVQSSTVLAGPALHPLFLGVR